MLNLETGKYSVRVTKESEMDVNEDDGSNAQDLIDEVSKNGTVVDSEVVLLRRTK
jgi:hypothetical protein